MKRLLITGASGFVGRHCVKIAVERGYEVYAVTSGKSNIHESVVYDNLQWITANLLDPKNISDLMQQISPSHILHTAWVTDHGSYWTSPTNLDWLAFGTRLSRLFAECGGERFVSVGTCAEYDWSHGFMVEGLTPENPATFYGKIKLAHHHTLMAASSQLGFSASTGRIFFAYGPYENPSRFIPSLSKALALGSEAAMGTGEYFRDFMHVQDVANGLLFLLDSHLTGSCNISSGRPYRLIDIGQELAEVSGKPDLLKPGSMISSKYEPPMIVGCNAKLISTGWSPTINLRQGLHDAYAWWATQQLENPKLSA